MSDACSNCKFWDSATSKDNPPSNGLCRYSAPRIFDTHIQRGQWPVTGKDDWCGEFVVKP